MSTKQKVVRISESELVATIDKIVTEAVAQKKTEWLSEQTKNEVSKLEETISKIVAKQLAK